jgi:small-conductance mechanosensitive channel
MPEQLSEFLNYVLVSMPGDQSITIGKLIAVVVLLVGGYALSRFVGHILGSKLATTRLRPDAIDTIKRVTFLTLLVLVILTALSLLGVPLTAFAFATGAIAIGVGFGAHPTNRWRTPSRAEQPVTRTNSR